MKKLAVSVLSFLIAVTAALMPISVSAGASATGSGGSCSVGETVKVKFTVNADSAIASIDAVITFDKSMLSFTGASDTLGNGKSNIAGNRIAYSAYDAENASKQITVTVSFVAQSVGTADVSFGIEDMGDEDENFIGTAQASASVSVKAKASDKLSDNCNLASLTVPKGCTLEPSFSKSVTSYTCNVPNTVENFPMDWKTEDSSAKTSVSGAVALSVGENTRSVKVTAADGTTKTYTVKIIRRKAEDGADETPAPDDTSEETPITVNVDGTDYEVMRRLTLSEPVNFSTEYVMYSDYEIEVFTFSGVYLAQLYDGKTSKLFVYDLETEQFGTYYSLSANNIYTVLTGSLEGYNAVMVGIGGKEYPALTNESTEDGYVILYVLNNLTGEKYFATYCAFDESVQRLMSQPVSVPAGGEGATSVNSGADGTAATVDKKTAAITGAAIGALLVAVLIAIIFINFEKPRGGKKQKVRNWGLDDAVDYTECDGAIEDDFPRVDDDNLTVDDIVIKNDNGDTGKNGEFAPPQKSTDDFDDFS